MPRKSGFWVFILSFLPGVAHVYIGAKERALRFGVLFWGVVAINIVFQEFYWNLGIMDLFRALSCIYLPIVALIAMIDAFKINNQRPNMSPNELDGDIIELSDIKLSRRTLATILSVIPGVGHLYMGYRNQGLCFLAAFFGVSAIHEVMHLEILEFILPVIWFYAIFDAWHKSDTVSQETWENNKAFNIKWYKWLGWGLIVIGILSIGQLGWEPFTRNLTDMINSMGYRLNVEYIEDLLQTSLLAIVFVIGGILILLRGSKKRELPNDNNEEDEI